MHIVTPQNGAHLFKNVNEAKGEEHLIEVIAFVKMPEQQPFKQQTKEDRKHSTQDDGDCEALCHGGQGPSQVSAQHVETTVRQIDHAHDAENQSQACSQHEQQQSVLNTVQQLDEEIDEIHRRKLIT